MQSLSSGISEQPAQLSTACGEESCFPNLHEAAGEEQHPLRKAEKWVTGCELPSEAGESCSERGRLCAGPAVPCKLWLARQAEARKAEPRALSTQSQACWKLEGATTAPLLLPAQAQACGKAHKLLWLTAGPFPFHPCTCKEKSADLTHAEAYRIKRLKCSGQQNECL